MIYTTAFYILQSITLLWFWFRLQIVATVCARGMWLIESQIIVLTHETWLPREPNSP